MEDAEAGEAGGQGQHQQDGHLVKWGEQEAGDEGTCSHKADWACFRDGRVSRRCT